MDSFNKLDVAAKMFPSVENKNNSSVFRISVVMKEEVDKHALQLAVNVIYQRYELFFLRMRRGVFWEYFDKNYFHFTVQEECETPCNNINSFENRGYIIKVLYHKNRISVETFHAITDGSGVSEFVKSLVYYYICIKYELIDHQGKVLLFDQDDKNDNDSFNEYFASFLNTKQKKESKLKNSLQIRGQKFRKGGHSVVTGVLSVDAIKNVSKQKQCTITAYMLAVMIWAIYDSKQKDTKNKKPIVVSVPVNLRKIFDSNTLKNFFGVVQIGYEMTKETTFDELLESISEQLTENTGQDNLKRISTKNIKISENNVSRHTPLILKNVIIPIGFNYMGEHKKTLNLSNIGRMDFPDEAKKYIEHTEVLSYPTKGSPINCTVCSYEDKLSINFIRSIKDASIIQSFFSILAKDINSDIQVYSNIWGEDNELKEKTVPPTPPPVHPLENEKRCAHCGVKVYDSETKCPLCHAFMGKTKETKVEYPKYQNILNEKSSLRNVPLFVATTAMIICIYINIFTHDKGEIIWSIIASASLLFSVAMLRVVRTRRKRYGSKVVQTYLLLSALIVTIDFTTGLHFWSTNYVFPFLTLATVIYLTILAIRSKRLFSEYFGYIMAVIFIDIVATVMDIIIFRNTSWGVFITVISSLILLLGLYLFADKPLKEEIKKRLYR